MHSRTPFQFLEPHIVRNIVDNVVESGDEERLKPLLHVCHNFRTIALPLYFRYYKLILRRRARRPMVRTSSANKYLGHPTHHLARDLDIELDEKDVYTDAALQILSREPYDLCAFPFARQITFFIVLGDNIQTEQSVVVANIIAFVERVKQMAPRASDFRLSPVACRGIHHTTVRHFDYLATRLFQLVEKAKLCFVNGHEYHWEPQLDDVFNLVHIRHTTRHNIPTFIRLARLNVRTLESLDIMIANTTGVSSIIQDADGTYISYPCLVTLFLGGGSYVSNLPLPVFEDAMPFPILQRLKIPFMYPIGDDAFFRGNAATLEYLSIELNRAIVVMLREHSVFTPRSHPSLRRVNVEYDNSFEPGELTSNAEALQLVLSIGTRASVRVTNIPATGADLMRATTSLRSYASIQVLSLCLTTLDLWEVINLIMLLPFLSDLSTKPPVARALPSGVTLDDLPAFMALTFAPMDDKDDNGTSRAVSSRYYFIKVICVADRLFGRHTRCFLATANRPAKRLKVDESLEATVIIKDAFAIAKPIASEDDHDEVKTLKKIRATFERNNPDSILYAKIVVGGRVRFKRGGRIVEDIISTTCAGVSKDLLAKVFSDLRFRAHRRIVMDTIGESLQTVKTAKEFVAVICDAMLCHYAIVDKCKILHRDISDNNIQVVRMKGGTVRGLLIDFDCAIDISKDKTEVRGEMTGTFPFTNLNNLTCSTVTCMNLEDWESVLYLLCWYVTIGFGTGKDCSEVQVCLKDLPIAWWRNDMLDTIVNAKCLNLLDEDTLETVIVDMFDKRDKNSKHLGVSVLRLYEALFANKLGKRYHKCNKCGFNFK
ncbi:hypothetical protein GGI13_001137 [Coemansia sp. RSA 455]|nr:hypothetical protein GGI13_001137 [Coemansia sp. RSA 455]